MPATTPPTPGSIPPSSAELRTRLGTVYLAVPRRPLGVAPPPLPPLAGPEALTDERAALGVYFAGLSYYAAASVDAFDRVAAELAADDAPAQLHVRARAAARAATNHASLLAELAARHGVDVPAAPKAPPLEEDDLLRPLLERARDNVVEGCVREGFGALVAWHHALAAEDSLVRKVFAVLAHDGTAQVELARELRAWFDDRLTGEARWILGVAERSAVAEVRAAAAAVVAAPLTVAGYPGNDAAAALVEQGVSALWPRG